MSEKMKYRLTEAETEELLGALNTAAHFHASLLDGQVEGVDTVFHAERAEACAGLWSLAQGVEVVGITVKYRTPPWNGA